MRSGVLVLLCLSGCGTPAATDVQLAAPPAGQGWQWEVPRFDVPAGTEIQACYFLAVPGTGDVWVDRIAAAQTIGSHHMNIMRVKTITGLSGRAGDVVVGGQCFGPSSNWADWPMVVNSQDALTTDWTLPANVGQRFTGGELLMIQTHYVNARTQSSPIGGHVLVNFYTTPAAPANELGSLFATNQHIRICPGDHGKVFTARCTFPSNGVHIAAANGHFHSRGTKFEIGTVDAAGTPGATFYTSTRWDEPPMVRDIDVLTPPNGGIEWSCTYDYVCPAGQTVCGDTADSNCFTFGGHVETQEHCNAFVYYWPKLTTNIACF